MISLSEDGLKTMSKNNPFAAYVPDAETMQKTAEAWLDAMPLSGLVQKNALAAHPMAAAAAASAVGFGVASHMWGVWLGSMTGAMEAADRLQKAAAKSGNGASPTTFMPDLYAFEWGFPEAAEAPAKTRAKPAPKPKAEAPAKVKAEAPAKPEKVAKTEPVAEKAPLAEAAGDGAFVRPSKVAKPEQPDDLKMISGVGPKLEQVLNSLGIWTFKQIAEWTPNEVAWVDDFLQFSGRIVRDDWIRQADALARGGRDEYVKVFGKEPR